MILFRTSFHEGRQVGEPGPYYCTSDEVFKIKVVNCVFTVSFDRLNANCLYRGRKSNVF